MSTTYPDLTYTTFPDQEQSFVEMEDITTGDVTLLTQYQQAMLQGNFQAARQALSQMINANNKLIDSVKINTLFDTCVALERFYKSDIEPYLEQKQQEWEATVAIFTNDFGYVGNFSLSGIYKRNNIVSQPITGTNNTLLYIALQDTQNQPLHNTIYWRPLTIIGNDGEAGEGTAFLGAWNSTQNYTADDVVAYNNQLWQATQANTGQTPAEGSQYWASYGAFNFTNIYVNASVPNTIQPKDYWFQIV